MAKLVRLDKRYYPNEDFGYWCPGCGYGHEIAVSQPNHSNAKWTFDGNFSRPTFSPSLNLVVNPKGHKHHQPALPTSVCHCFIKDGQIQFLGDCTHALKGQTVPMPDVPENAYRTMERLG